MIQVIWKAKECERTFRKGLKKKEIPAMVRYVIYNVILRESEKKCSGCIILCDSHYVNDRPDYMLRPYRHM